MKRHIEMDADGNPCIKRGKLVSVLDVGGTTMPEQEPDHEIRVMFFGEHIRVRFPPDIPHDVFKSLITKSIAALKRTRLDVNHLVKHARNKKTKTTRPIEEE